MLDHESVNRIYKVFYIEQALELQIMSGFNFVFPDGWHMTMNMLLGMLIGGTGEKRSSPWWDALVLPFLERTVFQGVVDPSKIEHRHVEKDTDFNELYDIVMILSVAYYEL